MSRARKAKRGHGRFEQDHGLRAQRAEICTCSKVLHLSKGAAREALRCYVRSFGDVACHPMKVYRCPAGGGWHIGHTPSKKAQDARNAVWPITVPPASDTVLHP